MNDEQPFEVGRRYRNNLGEYEVLSVQGDRLTVRFNDGQIREFGVRTQARIWQRIQEEQRRALSPSRPTARAGAMASRGGGVSQTRQPRRGIQHWLKPQGVPDTLVDESESFTADRYLIGFARRPSGVEVGDVLIVYRIGIAMIQYAAEALDVCRKATADEVRRELWRARWEWTIEARNLTPDFGAVWRKRELRPRPLAVEYSAFHPGDPVSLGALNYGADKLRISEGFGQYLLELMRTPLAPGRRPPRDGQP